MTAPYIGTQTPVALAPSIPTLPGRTPTDVPPGTDPGGPQNYTPSGAPPQPPRDPGPDYSKPAPYTPSTTSSFRTMTPTTITQANTFNPNQANFAQLLAGLFNNYQQPGQAPQWTPGQNPFAGSFNPSTVNAGYTPQNMRSSFNPGMLNGQAQPGSTYQGTFSTVNAPGTQMTGPVTSAQNPLGGPLQQALYEQIQNPSAYGAPQVQQAYNYLSQGIDDQFAQKQALTEEDMARRGLADSSIRGGRLSDLNVANKSAHEDLANNILMQQAQTLGQDRNSAISAAMGYGNQVFGQNLATQQQQGTVNDQNFRQALAAAAFQGDQNAMQVLQNMNIAGFNNQVGQQDFQNRLTTQGFNNQAGQQGFQNRLAQLGFNNANAQQGFNNAITQGGFNNQAGQQGFENQFNTWLGNNNQQQQGFQNQLNSYGAGLTGNQQGFNQQQQLLANMLGYNQQDFQNQQSTWQDNQGAQEWYQQLMAMLAQQGAA